MTPPSELANRRSWPQQARGRPWPILVLLFGLTALTLALTACGGSSNTGSPDATGSAETNEWDETVAFSVGWLDTQLIEIPVEKCEMVVFHLVASENIEVRYRSVSDWSDRPDYWLSSGHWGGHDDLRTNIIAKETGIWTLLVHGGDWLGDRSVEVTVSYRVNPPRSGITC